MPDLSCHACFPTVQSGVDGAIRLLILTKCDEESIHGSRFLVHRPPPLPRRAAHCAPHWRPPLCHREVCVCCSVLQCVAVCCRVCRVLRAPHWRPPLRHREVDVCCSVFTCVLVAVCCSVLQCVQCVAVCCSVLQCVAVCLQGVPRIART